MDGGNAKGLNPCHLLRPSGQRRNAPLFRIVTGDAGRAPDSHAAKPFYYLGQGDRLGPFAGLKLT